MGIIATIPQIKLRLRGLSKVKLSQIKAFFREALVGRINQEQPRPRGQKGLGNGVGQGRREGQAVRGVRVHDGCQEAGANKCQEDGDCGGRGTRALAGAAGQARQREEPSTFAPEKLPFWSSFPVIHPMLAPSAEGQWLLPPGHL